VSGKTTGRFTVNNANDNVILSEAIEKFYNAIRDKNAAAYD
jgi:hypothetical protein